ncbi:MAG: ArsR/SmtB family transcription factor [Candidatus Dormibacteria bacterium]
MKDSVMRSRPRRALPGAIAAGAFDLSVHFEGLANPTRLAVVGLLARSGELGVGELAARCQVSQPRMSWHLRILRSAQVVTTRREGREVLCSLDRKAIARHLQSFVQLLSVRAEPGSAAQLHQSIEGLSPVTEGTSA